MIRLTSACFVIALERILENKWTGQICWWIDTSGPLGFVVLEPLKGTSRLRHCARTRCYVPSVLVHSHKPVIGKRTTWGTTNMMSAYERDAVVR